MPNIGVFELIILVGVVGLVVVLVVQALNRSKGVDHATSTGGPNMTSTGWPPAPVGSATREFGPVAAAGTLPPVLMRTYTGRSLKEANAAFQADAPYLSANGYVVASQTEAASNQQTYVGGLALISVIVGLLFTPALILGVVLAVAAILIRRPASVSVAYELPRDVESARSGAPAVSPGEAAAAPSNIPVQDRLAQLDALRASGAVTDEEYASKRAKILDEL